MTHPQWVGDLLARIDAQDTAGFLAFLTDDAVFRFGSAPPVQGAEAIGEAVDAFFQSIAALEHRLHQTWQDADAVICRGEVTYTRHDGRQLTMPFANFFTMEGDRIRTYLIYIDVAPLFA